MNSAAPILAWIDSQRDAMADLLTQWANINSWSHHLDGLARMSSEIEKEFASLGAAVQHHDLPPMQSIDSMGRVVQSPLGQVIQLVKRPDAQFGVLLGIHFDTVYSPQSPFQSVTHVDENTLRGPGVADAKGGLVVLLYALRALEQSPLAGKIGWEVLLNPDEEIGSPGSAQLWLEAARHNHVGLLFEPALPDGSLVGARKGSGNFTFVIHGRSAHVGRDIASGRSAILAAADVVKQMDSLQRELADVIVNCGRIEGGGPLNVVPDLAIARFNVRISTMQNQQTVEQRIAQICRELSQRDGIKAAVHGGFHAPPKTLDDRTNKLFAMAQACAGQVGLKLDVRPTGGACDGNRLAAAGLPVIDSLGPCGGGLHSEQEFVLIDSLVQRTKLTLLLLLQLASQSSP